MKLKLNNKGLSLPLTLGLLLLLVTITTTLNELVIRALRASHQIEASDKAYFAAEGGIEDALYELSAHTAGYETGNLADGTDARSDNFSESFRWQNEWEIKDRGLDTCTDSLETWEQGFTPQSCGRLYEGDKLVLNLFTDDAPSGGMLTGEINTASEDINTLSVNNLTIKFRLPVSVVDSNPNAFNSGLLIDNDGDLGTSSKGTLGILGLNEDGAPPLYPPNICPTISGNVAIDDNDCDGREDEDSPEDPVLLWKLVDSNGHSFQPLRGCKEDSQHSSHPGFANAILCEKNFSLLNSELSVTLSDQDYGTDETGAPPLTLQSFLSGYAGSKVTLQMEILVAAPLEAVSAGGSNSGSKILIPYLEYGIDYTANSDLPATFFAVKSDGYYQDFKQSITTNVVPRATTRLLDLTIIQQ